LNLAVAGGAAFAGPRESTDVEDRSQLKVRDSADKLIFSDLQAMADHAAARHWATAAFRPSRAPVHPVHPQLRFSLISNSNGDCPLVKVSA